MLPQGKGRIINVGSVMCYEAGLNISAYAAAKSTQIGLARSWAHELAPLGITVNTVAPGFIPVERHATVADHTKQTYLASVPRGRMGTAEDVAHAVSFFASDKADFITGQRIVVDGGRGLGP